ncbi:MAG: dTDP-4-dehydrorhamnose reductase [Lentimicrobiaceae bacterium]|jgi:dTDP-4-dehydrorhamnose reductase|nr:dTDP-4-dehydrorhamnose reductase [Lentimicrobiaceae bacterium]
MNILVTGANGQLGTELQKIAATDKIHNWYFTDIDTLDITSRTQIEHFFTNKNIEVCINCAAYTAVDKAEEEPEKALLINAEAPEILAHACYKNDAFLVHISTDYVFDGENYKPYIEENPVCPKSAYAFSKAKGEENVIKKANRYVIMRTSWLYAASGNNFVKTMTRLAKERGEINVVSDQIGTPTWAFDLAVAIMYVIDKFGKENIREIFHFSNEGVASWYDFAKAIIEIQQLDCKINPIESKDFPTPTKRPFYSVLNKTKFKQFTGITIPYWRDSLEKCLNELNKQQ